MWTFMWYMGKSIVQLALYIHGCETRGYEESTVFIVLCMPFYIMDFWHSRGLLEPIPCRYQGTIVLALKDLILVLTPPLTLEVTWPLWASSSVSLNKIVELLIAIPFSVQHSALEKYKLAAELWSLNMAIYTLGNNEDLWAKISHSF